MEGKSEPDCHCFDNTGSELNCNSFVFHTSRKTDPFFNIYYLTYLTHIYSLTYLTVDRYGNFTAYFKPHPPTILPEYVYLIISVIISSLIGWSIPSIIGWAHARTQRKHLKKNA
ncbi:MAG: hypothetical protein WA667_27745 [Candidatus Nitrosopolaris sp.]